MIAGSNTLDTDNDEYNLHALAVLAAIEAEPWNWPLLNPFQQFGEHGGNFKAIALKLLSGFIEESQAYPDSQLVDQFWFNVQRGYPSLQKNIERLKTLAPNVAQEETMKVLFEGIDPKDVDLSFVFDFSADLLTHLGIALQNRSKSGDGTPHSLTEFISKDIDELFREAGEEEFGSCRKEILTALAFKRDGFYCPFTDISIDPTNSDGVVPVLSQIIPSSVHNKPDTLKFIAILAGTKLRDLVVEQLNGIGNIMNIEWNTSKAYDDIKWAIQAKENDDGKVTYIFRKFVGEKTSPGPAPIKLRDGDEIQFGKGGGRNVEGPLPALCNLQSAVARVLRMSGAADLIAHLQDIADESDLSNEPGFANILAAKLLLNSGRFLPL